METMLEQLARYLQIQKDRIVEIKDEAIRNLLGGLYFQEGKAILLNGSLDGPMAILLSLELVGINKVRLNFATIVFTEEGKLHSERSQITKIEPSEEILGELDPDKPYIDLTTIKEVTVVRLFPGGGFRQGKLGQKYNTDFLS